MREQLTVRGAVGETAVAGAQARATQKAAAQVAASADRESLRGFVSAMAAESASVCTDEAAACAGLERGCASVRECVGGQVHPNGGESFRSMLQRGCY